MNKKRILLILHVPPPVHGSSIIGQSIIQSQALNSSFDCAHINLSTSRKMSELGGRVLLKSWRYSRILVKVFWRLVKHRHHLCYLAITVKGTAFFKDAIVALLVKAFRVPIVYHFHNKGVSNCQCSRIYDWFYRLLFRNSRAILLSKHLYSDIQKYFSEDKVFYCPNGIPDFCDYAETYNAKTRNNGVGILFLSNLFESKGVLVLLEGCRMLKEQRVPVFIRFIGGVGDLTVEECRKRAFTLGIDDIVSFEGPKFGQEKDGAFLDSDIFVFPTYNECFPLVLLEAMKYGLPVVSTYEGGIEDIVDDGLTGFLVQQRDAQMLDEKVKILVNNRNMREAFGKAGRLKYEKEFTLAVFEERMSGILEDILDQT